MNVNIKLNWAAWTLGAIAMVGVLSLAQPAVAATYTWDASGNGGETDGGGTWSTTNANWWSGTADVGWPNTTTYSASFGVNNGAAGAVTVSGSVNVNSLTFNAPGSGNYTLNGGTIGLGGTTPTITTNVAATINSVLGGAGGLTKTGPAALTLGGNNIYPGSTTVSAGTLNYFGSSGNSGAGALTIGNVANTVAVVNINTGGTLNFVATNIIGDSGTGAGAVNLAGGTIITGSSAATYTYIGDTGYGSLNISGGAIQGTSIQNGIQVGYNNNGLGSMVMTGGVVNITKVFFIGDAATTGNVNSGVVTLTGGTCTHSVANETEVGYDGGSGCVNVGTETGGSALFNNNVGGVQFGSSKGVLNLNSGTLGLNSNAVAYGIQEGTGSGAVFNANGGVISLGANITSLTDTSAFLTYAYKGGLIINTQNYSSTLAGAVLQASGSGIYANNGSGTLPTVSGGGSGYIGAPLVGVAGGSGSGATAVADVSNGIVTGVTLTCPGQNYQVGDVLTFSFSGGGYGTPATSYQYTLTAQDLASNVGGLTLAGSGILTLSSANNSYAGVTTINGGTLAFKSGAMLGPGGAIINGGVLAVTSDANLGPVPGSPNTNVIINSGGTLNALSSFTLSPNRGVGLADSNANLSVATGGTLSYGGVLGIAPGSTQGSLTKIGSGTLVLSGSSVYTGPTNVNTGWLYVNGSLSSGGAVNVAGGATLGGNGSAGQVAVAAGGTIDVSQNATGSTFMLAGLSFSGSGTINVSPSSSSTLDISVGNLAAYGGANSVDINIPGSSLASGLYRLIGYSGTIGGSGSGGFSVTYPPLGGRQVAQLQGNSGEIDLQVTGDYPVWTGAQNSNWTTAIIGGNSNWVLATAGTATDYREGDTVLFSDNAVNPLVNISSANVHPTSTTFSNNLLSYTLTGAFGIAGSGSLAINGGGSVTIATSNSYTGNTTLSNGLLNINNPSAIGAGTLVIAGGTLDNTSGAPITLSANNPQNWNADFVFNGTNDLNLGTGAVTLGSNRTVTVNAGNLTVGGPISGAGKSLSVAGQGNLILSGSNTYSGGTLVLGGTLTAASNGALGSGPVTMNPTSPSVLAFTSAAPAISSFADSGVGDTIVLGNAVAGSATVLTIGINNASSSFNTTITDLSSINSAATGALVKVGTGTLMLGGAVSTYSGGTTIGGGTLLANGSSYPTGTSGPLGAGPITFAGGTLQPYPSSGASLVNPIVVAPGTNSTVSDNTSSDFTVKGAITGSGTLTVAGAISDSVWLYGDLSGFTGTLGFNNIASGVNFRLDGSASDGSQTTFLLSGSTVGGATTSRCLLWVGLPNTTVQIGALTGSGGILGGNGDNYVSVAGTNFAIGALGTNTTFGGVIADGTSAPGNVAISKVGSGMLTLTGPNSYAGGTTVTSGTLQVGNVSALGSGSVTANGGVLDLAGFSPAIRGLSGLAGTITNNGSTNATLSVNPSLMGAFGGSIQPGAGGKGIALQLGSTGGLTLTGSNTVTSAAVNSMATLEVDGMLTSNGSLSVNNNAQLTGVGTINFSSTAGLLYGSAASSTFNGTLAGGSGITVTGGQLNLAGSNTYTGSTNVNGGWLNVNGSLAPSSSINVAAAARLGGSGSVGNVSVAAGGIIDVSQNPAASTFTMAALNFTSSATIDVNPYSSTNVDVSVGTLAANGGVKSVDINIPGSSLASGTYRLIGYSSAVGSSGSGDFTVSYPPLSGGQSAQVQFNSNQIDLVVTGDYPVWTGAQNSNWTTAIIGGNSNWVLAMAGTATDYANGDAVVFSDSAANSVVNISDANVSPASTTFSNNVLSYTLNGPFGIAGSGSLTIKGGGSVTITTSNTYTGNTILSSGLLNINNPSAIGTGTLVISGGTLDNTSGAPITLTTNNPQIWDADIIFNGSNNLNLGTGAVTLGSNGTVTVNASVLTVGGPISGPGMSLSVAGSGTLVLNGSNTFSGPLNLNGGVLNFAGGYSLGGGTAINFNGGTLQYGASNTYDITTAPAIVTLNVNGGTIDTNGNNVSFANGLVGAGPLTKVGLGTLTLSGTESYQGNTYVNAGTIYYNNATSSASQKLFVGYNAFQAAAVIQTVGSLSFSATPTRDVMSIGGGGYGYYQMNGGALTTSELALVGRYVVGTSGAGDPNSTAVFDLNGGVVSDVYDIVWTWNGTAGGAGNGPNAVFNISKGTVNNSGGALFDYGASLNSLGALNLLGSAAAFNAINGQGINLAYSSGNFGGFLNLNGGVVATNFIDVTSTAAPITPSFLNFSGGTLRANSSTAAFVSGLTAATIYAGGATVDTNGNNVTISQPLLAPTGSGVTSISLASSGAGYIGDPAVRITDSSGQGQGAAAIAEVDVNPSSPTYGEVIGIIITSPGTGYANPVATLYGGGATTPASVASVTSGTVAGGGLTVAGSGTLTLNAANTYTGGTNVEAGVLVLGNNSALGSGALTVNASGTVDLHGYQPTVTTLNGGGTILNAASGAANASILTVTAGGQFSGVIQDGGFGGNASTGLVLTDGVLTLSGSDSFSGGTDIEGGTLLVASPAALLNGSSLSVGYDASSLFAPALAGPALVVSPAGAAVVPEPGTLALLLAFCCAAIYCRIRRPNAVGLRFENHA